jgi:hypothetical protein
MEKCGKCVDPMFTYPYCEVRNWILEDSTVNCHKLPTKMPEYLYNEQFSY